LAENNALEIAAAAKEKGVFLWVDMEGSEHTDSTISIYGKMLSASLRNSASGEPQEDLDDVRPLGVRGSDKACEAHITSRPKRPF
jgi:hypothetical protein